MPINKSGVADLGAVMLVAVQAQLVNSGESSPTGYFQWKAMNQPVGVVITSPTAMLNPTGLEHGGTIANDNAEKATSGSTLTISGILQDVAGNPVKNAAVAIQDYDVVGMGASNNVQNDAYVTADGTTKLFSAVDYPTVTTDSNGNFSIQVTANIPVTQRIQNSIVRYYAFYIPSSMTIPAGQALPNTVTPLMFLGNANSGNFIDVIWQQDQTIQAVGVSHTCLMPTYDTLSDVPQAMSFAHTVGDHEGIFAAAYNKNGSIIPPSEGNQFDGYTLVYDLTAPNGLNFSSLGTVALPVQPDGTGISRLVASYNQYTGFVLSALYYADGTVCYQTPMTPDGNWATPVAGPVGFDPSVYATAYDGSGQLHFYLNSNQTTAVNTSGTSGAVKVKINAYANTSFDGMVDTHQTRGSAMGTINASFMAGSTLGSLGVVSSLKGINNYYPLLQGNAAPPSTLTIAGIATPYLNKYDVNKNGQFIAAPFNSYPAIATIPSQGLTMKLNADKNGTFTNVDGYVLATPPTSALVNINSVGEVSVNNVKLWTAMAGFKVVGYLPNNNDGSITIIEQSAMAPTNFAAYNVVSPGVSQTQNLVASWTVDSSALPRVFEGFLGFQVVGGQLVPQVASYYANNYNQFYTPLTTDTSSSTLTNASFLPVTAITAYVSDMHPETMTVTVTNSLNSQTATVTTNFIAANGALVAVQAYPSSVNSVLGGQQSIILTAQDEYGNPISNQSIFLQTGIKGLWLTQVNGVPVTGSVSMGTGDGVSLQTVDTPVPLFNLGSGTIAPAYINVSATGLTAYHLNDNTAPIVSLKTGVDGTVAITLVDGSVTYVANTAETGGGNNYAVDPGAPINQAELNFYPDVAQTHSLGSVQLTWIGSGN